MDSRINTITNLKDYITSRNSIVYQTHAEDVQELPSPEQVQYGVLRKQIKQSSFFRQANRHLKIRLQKWIEYLDKIKTNRLWIKSRNKYIKILNLMCYCEVIIEPFNSLPPQGELPTLRKHQLNQIIDQVEYCVKSSVNVSRKMSRIQQMAPVETIQQEDQLFLQQLAEDHKRCQTFAFNQYTDRQENEIPLQSVDINTDKYLSTEPGSSKKKRSSGDKQNKQKKCEKWHVEKLKNSQSFCKSQKRSHSFEKKNPPLIKQFDRQLSTSKKKPFQLKNVNIAQERTIRQKPPVCPSSQKNMKSKKTEKGYWQSKTNSELHTPHTPKYLNILPSQHADLQQEVILVSVRGKEGEGCCSGMSGDTWVSRFFQRILS